jgi:hypothetical protein
VTGAAERLAARPLTFLTNVALHSTTEELTARRAPWGDAERAGGNGGSIPGRCADSPPH